MSSRATLSRRFKRSSAGTKKPINLRLDIQGLRAFAVIVVILDHMFGWPSGGFVGVDVFFVISGFLITGHLMREWERNGKISFWAFYKGRIKRILPAATLVLAVTVAFSFFIFSKSRSMSVLWDGIAAALFSGNWRFASAGTDYFQAEGPVSPLQHFWSLAVEEQFYFVWPCLMVLALVFVRRSKASNSRPRVVAGFLIALICALSFAWAWFESITAPTVAYFSTFTRAWELGFGALLAIGTPLLLKISNGVRPALAWAGIAGMVISVAVIDSGMLFPAPTALLPVVSTGLVIMAGTGGTQRFLLPLANPVTKYVGDISYSLYLWHFPVIILLGPLLPWDGPAGYLAQVGLIALFSVTAYHLWEDAIRKSPWLDGDKKRWRDYHLPASSKYVGLVSLATAFGLVAVYTFTPAAPAPVAAVPQPAAQKETKPEVEEVTYGPEVTQIQEELADGLALKEWPETTPSIDDAIGSPDAHEDLMDCGLFTQGENDSLPCAFGDGKKDAVIVGDSVSMAFAKPIIDQLGDEYTVKLRAAFSCPFVDTEVQSPSPNVQAACPDRNAETVRMIKDEKPELIFVSTSYTKRVSADTGNPITPGTWATSVSNLLKDADDESQVVFLSPPPADKDIAECFTRVSQPASCISRTDGQWLNMMKAERSVAQTNDWTYVDTRPLFCFGQLCPAVTTIPVKSDATHITVEYGEHISAALVELIEEAGVKL